MSALPALRLVPAPPARGRFDAARQAMLRALRDMIADGADPADLADEIDSTNTAMRQLVDLAHG